MLGAGAALGDAGLLRNLLFNVEPLDPTALIAGAVPSPLPAFSPPFCPRAAPRGWIR